MGTHLLRSLLSRQGIVVIKLAEMLLTHQAGDRIWAIQQYAERFGTGVGTVQAALAFLQEIGAVELDSRGHLGTFIVEIKYPLLWSLTGQNHIVGGMPLPYSRRYEGLATGLYQAFVQAGVALSLVYTRGSLNRLQALTVGRFDFVVLSRFALNNAVEHGLAIEEVMGLGDESYVGKHIVLLRDHDKREIEDGMRIGIDPSSIDQVVLARQACEGRDVEFVELSYMNLMASMERGQIDATVWNSDDFCASSCPFSTAHLSDRGGLGSRQESTEAVIAVAKGNQLALQTLRSIINEELVRDIQKRVMDNQLMPIY